MGTLRRFNAEWMVVKSLNGSFQFQRRVVGWMLSGWEIVPIGRFFRICLEFLGFSFSMSNSLNLATKLIWMNSSWVQLGYLQYLPLDRHPVDLSSSSITRAFGISPEEKGHFKKKWLWNYNHCLPSTFSSFSLRAVDSSPFIQFICWKMSFHFHFH